MHNYRCPSFRHCPRLSTPPVPRMYQWRFQDLTLGGGGVEKTTESVNDYGVSPILACFGSISIKIMLKMYRERSERKKK